MSVTPKNSPAEEHSAFLSKREVLRLIPICATTLWNWVRKSKFPKPLVMNGKTVWRASDVYDFMQQCPERLYKGMGKA